MAESLQMDAEGVWQLSHLGRKARVVHIVFSLLAHLAVLEPIPQLLAVVAAVHIVTLQLVR